MAEVKVLLAEDEALVRLVVAEELRDLGWLVTEVATSDEGIALIKSGHRFDLVVTDINMPGDTDGLDLPVSLAASIRMRRSRSCRAAHRRALQSSATFTLAKPCWDLASQFTKLLQG